MATQVASSPLLRKVVGSTLSASSYKLQHGSVKDDSSTTQTCFQEVGRSNTIRKLKITKKNFCTTDNHLCKFKKEEEGHNIVYYIMASSSTVTPVSYLIVDGVRIDCSELEQEIQKAKYEIILQRRKTSSLKVLLAIYSLMVALLLVCAIVHRSNYAASRRELKTRLKLVLATNESNKRLLLRLGLDGLPLTNSHKSSKGTVIHPLKKVRVRESEDASRSQFNTTLSFKDWMKGYKDDEFKSVRV